MNHRPLTLQSLGIVFVALSTLAHTFKIFILSGASMEPVYHEGDIVIALRSSSMPYNTILAYRPNTLRKCECFINSQDGAGICMFKYIDHMQNVNGVSKLYLLGYNEDQSVDSRAFGYVDRSLLAAVPILIIPRRGRPFLSQFVRNTIYDRAG